MDFAAFPQDLTAFAMVVLIDLALAGDNAVVIGTIAATLSAEQRRRAIALGVGAAMLFRIGFAVVATNLLAVVGLLLAGGILLLWVAWKMWRETRAVALSAAVASGAVPATPHRTPTTYKAAIWQILVADLAMSMDNVLAVAGAARDHIWALVFGLVLSIALMGFTAGLIARWLQRYHWLAYLGVAAVTYVAVTMIVEGSRQVLAAAV